MATKYVRSGAGGAGTGADWPNAYTSLSAAITGGLSAGDLVYMAHDHNKVYNANTTLSFPTGQAASVDVAVVDDSAASSNYANANTPAASTIVSAHTATEDGGTGSLTVNGNVSTWGVRFDSQVNLTFAASGSDAQRHENIRFRMGVGTANSRELVFGLQGDPPTANIVRVLNGDVVINNHTGSGVSLFGRCGLEWHGGTWTNTTAQPTNVVRQAVSSRGIAHVDLRDIDMSALSGTLYSASLNAPPSGDVWLRHIKMHASATLAAIATSSPGLFIHGHGCGVSTGKSSAYLVMNGVGRVDGDSAQYRTGGAGDGTDSYSMKVVATASSGICFGRPLRFKICDLWWDTTKSKVRIYVAQRSGQTRLKDNQFWIEAETVKASDVLGQVQNSRADAQGPLSAGTTLTTDGSSTWNGSALSSAVQSYVEVTPSGDQSGPMSIWGVLTTDNSAANAELWIDPEAELIA